MIRQFGVAAVAVALSFSSAHASDAVSSPFGLDTGQDVSRGKMPMAPVHMAPAMAPAQDWSGPYLAFGVSHTQTTYSSNTAFEPANARGTGVSLILGYNLQHENLVYGAEVMGNVDHISGTGTDCGLGPTFTCRSSVKNYLAARVRVGYALGDTLVFGTLGLASDMQDQTIRDGGVRVAQGKARHNGPVIGIGVEHAIDDRWGLRGDLEHYRLGTRNYDLAVPGPTSIGTRHNAARFSIVNRF